MRQYYEWGIHQLHKHGEELCGDSVAVSRHSDSVTVALSDGLGSGVKANILATLTTRIAMHMLQNELPLNEVVQTLSETLPVCNVRKLAYSTFAIAQFFRQGYARIVEFDSPPAILVRKKKVLPLSYESRSIDSKTVQEAVVDIETGDWVLLVSDGVINAGIGGAYPLGWGWDQAVRFVEEHAHPNITAQDLADKVAAAVKELFINTPGDDVSVVVIKVRKKQVANVLTGPTVDKQKDEELVNQFIKRTGKRIVCGGTTAKIVSHYLGQPLDVDLQTTTPEVPPLARLKGIDLVTEGILTLTQARELLRAGILGKDIQFKTDGASSLVRLLLEVDHIHFLVGQAVNPAHQNPDLPGQLEIRQSVIREIAEELRKRGKEVTTDIV